MMKKNRIIGIIFLLEMMVCFITTRVVKIEATDMKNLLVYPFVTLAEKLFNLSKFGNDSLAWLIFIEITLIPIMILTVIIILKRFQKIHVMLPMFSAYIFCMLYMFINPSVLVKLLGENGYYSIVDLEAAICYVFYTLFITYVIVSVIGIFRKSNESKIIGYLQIIITVVGMIMIANDIYVNYVLSINEYRRIYKEISILGIDMRYTKVFYIIKYAVELIPCLIYALMATKGISILDEMKKDRFSDEALKQVKSLSKISIIGIGVMLVVNLGYNVATLPYLSKLYGDYRCFEFPAYLIVFSLCILLFAKYMEDTKKIKEDNDMFV